MKKITIHRIKNDIYSLSFRSVKECRKFINSDGKYIKFTEIGWIGKTQPDPSPYHGIMIDNILEIRSRSIKVKMHFSTLREFNLELLTQD